MNNYSVLLLYPDYLAEDYGRDTFYSFNTADTPWKAIKQAQQLAAEENDLDTEQAGDFHPLLVLEGYQTPKLYELL